MPALRCSSAALGAHCFGTRSALARLSVASALSTRPIHLGVRRASLGHGPDVCVIVSASDRRRLEAMIGSQPAAQARGARARRAGLGRSSAGAADRNASRRQPADGLALAAALRRRGCGGLLRDKTRTPGKPPIPAGLWRAWWR